MNNNNILISILFLLSSSTVITNGILMINEKNNIHFHNLNNIEKSTICCFIYNEIFICIILIYNIIYYLYYFIFSCFSDKEIQFNYSCSKALFIISGLATNIFLFLVLVTHKNIINNNIYHINIIFNVNFILTIIITIIFKLIKNKKIKYNNLNNNLNINK